MYKMVIQVVLLSGAAIFFIVTQSDVLKSAPTSGGRSGLARLVSSSGVSGDSVDVFSGEFDWTRLDPRQLWSERPKTVKLSPKTIRVAPNAEPQDVAAQLSARGLDPTTVPIVKLD